MTDRDQDLPDIAAILGEVMQTIEPGDRPLMLAMLERLAAERYRNWAEQHADSDAQRGLIECAEREQQIAERAESVFSDAAATQDRLRAANPDLADLNRTLFEGRSLSDQFAVQAKGERAGGVAWSAFAAVTEDEHARAVFEGLSALEEANAEFLESLLG